jgi:hypothetical protein
VQAATTSLIQQSIHSLRAQGHANAAGGIIAAWQDFKPGLKSQMRALAKAARERMTNGCRQKIKRLKASLMKCQLEGGDSSLRAQLLEAMHRVQDARRVLKRRVVVASNDWSRKATTKHLQKNMHQVWQ